MASHDAPSARDVIALGRAVLGIELGSTRIKAVLINPQGRQQPHVGEPVRRPGVDLHG